MKSPIPFEELFSGFKKLLENHPEQKELIKKAAFTFWEEFWSTHDHYCQVCDKRLTSNEQNTRTIYDFLITCHQHRQHARKYDVDLIRKELGLPERTFFAKTIIDQL